MANVRQQITVTENPANTFKVDVGTLNLRGNQQNEVQITWELVNGTGSVSDWTFADAQGIQIKGASLPFDDNGKDGNKKWKWTRRPGQANGNEYDYTIRLVSADGTKKLTIDPTIINQP